MRILVTDAQELAGLGAIRSLGKAGHDVTAGFPSNLRRPASVYSRYCSGQRAYPDPWVSQPQFRQWLIRHNSEFDLVLPISEAALLAAYRLKLAAAARNNPDVSFLPWSQRHRDR